MYIQIEFKRCQQIISLQLFAQICLARGCYVSCSKENKLRLGIEVTELPCIVTVWKKEATDLFNKFTIQYIQRMKIYFVHFLELLRRRNADHKMLMDHFRITLKFK